MVKQTYSDCSLCERPFEYGFGKYYGRKCVAWNMMFCRTCLDGNWDGIVLEGSPKLKKKLDDANIKYELNAKGWLDIPA